MPLPYTTFSLPAPPSVQCEIRPNDDLAAVRLGVLAKAEVNDLSLELRRAGWSLRLLPALGDETEVDLAGAGSITSMLAFLDRSSKVASILPACFPTSKSSHSHTSITLKAYLKTKDLRRLCLCAF